MGVLTTGSLREFRQRGCIGVHLAARVCGKADADEVLVSRTVSDLVAASALQLLDRGEHELKGVPGRWQLLAVAAT